MEWTVLLAIIAFKDSTYAVQHYPMQVNPWIEKVEYNRKVKGQLKIKLKNEALSGVPQCRWSPLDSNSKAYGNIAYINKQEVSFSFFEKEKKKEKPKDMSFIVSCRSPKVL